MKKLIRFRDLGESIKEHADKHCEGNFSMAVRQLITKGLEGRKIDLSSKEGDAHLQEDLLK